MDLNRREAEKRRLEEEANQNKNALLPNTIEVQNIERLVQ